MTGFTAPSGGADAKYISATSGKNTVLVEIGKKYLVSAAMGSGFDVTSMSLTGCTVISQSNIVESDANGYRIAWLRTFYVKATATTLTLQWSVTSGGANTTLQAMTCYEI